MNLYSELLSCCDYQPEGSCITLKCQSKEISVALAVYRQRLNLEFQTFRSIRLLAPGLEYPTFSVEKNPDFLRLQKQIEQLPRPTYLVGFNTLTYISHNRICEPLAEGLCELHAGDRIDRLWSDLCQLEHLHRELKRLGKIDRAIVELNLPSGGKLHLMASYQLHDIGSVLIRQTTVLKIKCIKGQTTVSSEYLES